MSGITGFQFLKKAEELRPPTTRIILTDYTDVAIADRVGFDAGTAFLSESFIPEALKRRPERH